MVFSGKNIQFGIVKNLWKFQLKRISFSGVSCWRKTLHCGHKNEDLRKKETKQVTSDQVIYTLLHLLIFSMELYEMSFLEAIFRCREMKVHIALRCSAPSENIALLFIFQIAKLNSSSLPLKTQEHVLINLMSFSWHKFISMVSDECSLHSLSLSEVRISSPSDQQ